MKAPTTVPSIANLEGSTQFDVHWAWERGSLDRGITAVLRAKNEARSLPWVLPPLLDATQRVVLVDNRSTDSTAEVAREVAELAGRSDRLSIQEYPFDVSRCGPEHLETHPRSVHSLAYFYNWSFSHVRTTSALKWDGDMVLTREGIATFSDLSWQLRSAETIVSMPRHPLFVENDRIGYFDFALSNSEPWIYPMGKDYQFNKAFEWELLTFPDSAFQLRLPEGLCVELKYLDSDEFAHWTSPAAFEASSRAHRKRREWAVFNTLTSGDWQSLEGVERIEAPDDMHIIDYATNVWLARAPRPLVGSVRRP